MSQEVDDSLCLCVSLPPDESAHHTSHHFALLAWGAPRAEGLASRPGAATLGMLLLHHTTCTTHMAPYSRG
eukprot:5994366-Pyramimonas_sp.AAC.1